MKLFIFALLAVAATAEEAKKAEIATLPLTYGALPYASWGAYNTLPYTTYNTLPYTYASPYAYNYAPITTAAKIELPEVEVKKVELPEVELKAATYAYAAPATYAAAYAPATYAAAYAPATYAAPAVVPAVAPVASSQFQAQDELKNVNYGYSNINSVKQEVGNALTGVQGSYSYVDANGQTQVVNYIADALGFRVADSRLPVAPVYEGVAPEPVVYNGVAPVFDGVAPEPVEDTPEVAAAKAEFMKAFEAEKNREKRESDPSIVYGYNTMPFSYSAGYYSSALPIRAFNYPYTYGYSPRAFYYY